MWLKNRAIVVRIIGRGGCTAKSLQALQARIAFGISFNTVFGQPAASSNGVKRAGGACQNRWCNPRSNEITCFSSPSSMSARILTTTFLKLKAGAVLIVLPGWGAAIAGSAGAASIAVLPMATAKETSGATGAEGRTKCTKQGSCEAVPSALGDAELLTAKGASADDVDATSSLQTPKDRSAKKPAVLPATAFCNSA